MVRIGTWNLENLFRPGPSGPSDDTAYQQKLDSLAETITGLDPDVLGVQEVGDPEALQDLADKLSGYGHLETADPDGRGIRVGFLSKLLLQNVTQVTGFVDGLRPIQVDDSTAEVDTMGRAALHATVVPDGGSPVEVVTCHPEVEVADLPRWGFSTSDEALRARFGAYALFRRAAEATAVRAAATELLGADGQNRNVIVLGDLNDEPQAATTQILLGPPGSEIGTGGFAQADQGDKARLWNLGELIPEADRFSRIYRGRRELIDHIMASHKIVMALQPGDVSAGPAPASIDDNPNARRDEPGSDHRPLVLTFTP